MPNTTPNLQHDISVCFDTAKRPWEPFHAKGFPSGIRMRPLRKFDNGTPRSAILRIPPGWKAPASDIGGTTQQYFVLSGAIRVGDQLLRHNGFFAGFPGDALPALSSDAGADLVAIFEGTPRLETDGGTGRVKIIPDCFAVAPIIPVINGKKLEGFERRVLWENPANGADTRLLKIPAGFRGAGPNYHPVEEEIFMLAGDGGPDDTRRMTAGWYLWNPAHGVHGYNEHSIGGMTILEWHDALWSITFHTAP